MSWQDIYRLRKSIPIDTGEQERERERDRDKGVRKKDMGERWKGRIRFELKCKPRV